MGQQTTAFIVEHVLKTSRILRAMKNAVRGILTGKARCISAATKVAGRVMDDPMPSTSIKEIKGTTR